MEIRSEILELKKLGVIPNHDDDSVEDIVIEKFENLLGSLGPTINKDEGEMLILIFPKESCYGLEWTLLHLIESLFKQINKFEYEELILKCNSPEWKKLLLDRFRNSKE
ncbi:hypothetical protein ACFFLS_04800 [Flavobacterium procerum]|uniref:Uncharacterized protein n=1 Tax=Flavobacterium procerum TaxID=1455569 RepID=A0ABV6BLN9_9FLAO